MALRNNLTVQMKDEWLMHLGILSLIEGFTGIEKTWRRLTFSLVFTVLYNS
jgi:hypothetical protein